MAKKLNLRASLTFGFEQTFTITEWWTEEGFTAVSDTPLKRKKMLDLAEALAKTLGGSFKESVDIWGHMQYETFKANGEASFVVTMDPGSIEVKTPPALLENVEEMAKPLFKAAQLAELVPYRNWWYGIKGGTEGGCHVNMAGFTRETNPLKKHPDLIVKYCAYIHNRPWLHYPFMGIDVGPEGNCMRMDEKKGFTKVRQAFKEYNASIKEKKLTAKQPYEHFKETNIVTEKASMPSLYKFKSPDYFIEDRAQESLRSPEEFFLIANLRMNILENLQEKDEVESLKSFGKKLHAEMLTSYLLWEKFQYWANDNNLNPVQYQRFFDRQFPKLNNGNNIPTRFGIKEGRRPRKILEIKKRGDVVTSKTVDTRFKRFELYYYTQQNDDFFFEVKVRGLEHQSEIFAHKGYLGFGDLGQAYYCYIDLILDKENPILEITLKDRKTKKIIDNGKFNINDMLWI